MGKKLRSYLPLQKFWHEHGHIDTGVTSPLETFPISVSRLNTSLHVVKIFDTHWRSADLHLCLRTWSSACSAGLWGWSVGHWQLWERRTPLNWSLTLFVLGKKLTNGTDLLIRPNCRPASLECSLMGRCPPTTRGMFFLHTANKIMWRDRALRQHANITFSIKTERAGSEPRLKPDSRQGTQLSGATSFHFGSPKSNTK